MFFFKQKTAYEMRISDWSSDVCSSDLDHATGWSSTVSHPARHLIRALPTPLNDRSPIVPTYLLPRRYTLRFDPADLPVLAPIDHVERAGSPLAEQKRGSVAQLQHPHRTRHAGFGNIDPLFRNDKRIVAGTLIPLRPDNGT